MSKGRLFVMVIEWNGKKLIESASCAPVLAATFCGRTMTASHGRRTARADFYGNRAEHHSGNSTVIGRR